VFERFTDRARRVIVRSQEEARTLHHTSVGPEHLLLGLIHEVDGVAAQTLMQLDISLDGLRRSVEQVIGPGQRAGAGPSGNLPLTPPAKRVIELTLREALQLGHDYIGTEHLLLGLIREGDGVAAQVLRALGADLGRVRSAAIVVLRGYQRPAPTDGAEARLVPTQPRDGAAPDPAHSFPDRGHPVPDPAADPAIIDIRRRKAAAIDAQDFELAASLRDQEKALLRRLADRAGS